jgi:outer membrane immunogenic protein
LAGSALVFSGQVFAAEVHEHMPVHSWTGCYVGGHVGAGWDHTKFYDPGTQIGGILQQNIAPPGSSIDLGGGASAIGGVQAGCDYQFANNWVIGLAGDFAWASIKDQGADPFFTGKNPGPIPISNRTDELASLTGRVGYAWNQILFYGKGGAAWAHDRYSIQNLFNLNGSGCFNPADVACNPTGSTTRLGWAAGAGVEWAFAENWSAMVEYDHYGFDSKTIGFSDRNATSTTPALLNVNQNIDIIKVGLNYRFAWLGH